MALSPIRPDMRLEWVDGIDRATISRILIMDSRLDVGDNSDMVASQVTGSNLWGSPWH